MARLIVKLTDERNNTEYFFEWSTVVDAPITNRMLRSDFREYYISEYGHNDLSILDAILSSNERFATSSLFNNITHIREYNRAGENEKTLTFQEIIEMYND